MLYLVAFINVAVVSVMLVGIGYVKRLPQRLHDEGLRRFEHGLQRELEALRDALAQDRELLRIVRSDLQARKTDELVKLGEFFTDIFADPDKLKRLEKSPEKTREFKKKTVDLGTKLFFFTSDETVKAYLEWRQYGQSIGEGSSDPVRIMELFGEMMLRVRRDVGYPDTACTPDDFLRMFIIGWDEMKQKRLASFS